MKKTEAMNQELIDLATKVDRENFFAKTKREAFVPRASQLLIEAETSSQVIEIFRAIDSQDFMHTGSLTGGIKEKNFKHIVDGSEIKENDGATSTIMHRIGEFSAAKVKYIEKGEEEPKNFENEYGLLKQKANKDYKEGFNFEELDKSFEKSLGKKPNTNKIEQLRIVGEMSRQLVEKVNQAWKADFKDYSEIRQEISGNHSLRHLSDLCDMIENFKNSGSSEEQLKGYKETLSGWNRIVQSVLHNSPNPFGTISSAKSHLKSGLFGVYRYPNSGVSADVQSPASKTTNFAKT